MLPLPALKRLRLAGLLAALVAGCMGGFAGRAGAADIIVIVHPSAALPSREQVAEAYLGKGQTYLPLDLGPASSLREEFYRKATGRDLAQVKAAWARLVFTGRGQPPREVPSVADLKLTVGANPRAMGYIDRAALDPTVKPALSLD